MQVNSRRTRATLTLTGLQKILSQLHQFNHFSVSKFVCYLNVVFFSTAAVINIALGLCHILWSAWKDVYSTLCRYLKLLTCICIYTVYIFLFLFVSQCRPAAESMELLKALLEQIFLCLATNKLPHL